MYVLMENWTNLSQNYHENTPFYQVIWLVYFRFSHSHFRSIDEKEDDAESGRGASLPQSPHSVEGAIGGPSSTLLPSEVNKHSSKVEWVSGKYIFLNFPQYNNICYN